MVKYEIIREEMKNTSEKRFEAARKLSGIAFKLYCYFETFPEGTTTYIQKEFAEKAHLDARTVATAFKELLDRGYLKCYSSSIYFFYPECKNFIFVTKKVNYDEAP